MTWTKKDICKFVDLTSLNAYDANNSIHSFVDQALDFHSQGYSVAAVCLYPNFATLAVEKLKNSPLQVAVVAGNFPNAQGFISSKLHECELAIAAGVDEVDVVLNLGEFENGNYENVVAEIRAYKGIVGDKCLKVILETGYLKTEDRIRKASELAIAGGADFIKTSTGKEFPGASLEAAQVMAEVIAASRNERLVGLKISGGVRTYEEALTYLKLIEKNLGKDYMTPKHVRIGASSLVSNLMNG